MKRVLYPIFTIVCLISCLPKPNTTKKEPYILQEYEYPFLGQVLNSYYATYYKYPIDLNDFILFIEKNDRFEGLMNFTGTYLKLKKNKDNIKIRNEEEHYVLIENNNIEILRLTKDDICKDLNNGRMISHWINDILLFKGRELVQYKGMDTDIETLRKKLMFYRKKGEVRYFHDYDWEVLTYAHNKITFCCGIIDTLHTTLPIKQVKDTLTAFASSKQIDSMILAIPIVPSK